MEYSKEINLQIEDAMEMGICDTVEEAVEYLKSIGVIREESSFPFMPDGITKLEFNRGHQKSNFTKYNRVAKKAKKDEFEVGRFYVGHEIVTDKDGKIDLDSCKSGFDCGENPRIVIVKHLYFGTRFTQAGSRDNITTTCAKSMGLDDQAKMIDSGSKKSVRELRAEVAKKYNLEKYSNSDVKDTDKIKFNQYVFVLVEDIEGVWHKAIFITSVPSTEHNVFEPFQTENRNINPSQFIGKFDVTETADSDYIIKFKVLESYGRVPELKEPLGEYYSLYTETAKLAMKFEKDQADWVAKNKSKTIDEVAKCVEDTTEEDNIEMVDTSSEWAE